MGLLITVRWESVTSERSWTNLGFFLDCRSLRSVKLRAARKAIRVLRGRVVAPEANPSSQLLPQVDFDAPAQRSHRCPIDRAVEWIFQVPPNSIEYQKYKSYKECQQWRSPTQLLHAREREQEAIRIDEHLRPIIVWTRQRSVSNALTASLEIC